MISTQHLFNAAILLANAANDPQPFQQLLQCINQLVPSDAIALQTLQGDVLKPRAIQGLSADTLGRRFIINEHPRLEAICSADLPLRFAKHCPLPRPI